MAAKTGKKQPSFEDGLERLEEMAEQMERSDLPLEALMKLYEEGMALSEQLAKKLEGMKAAMLEIRPGKDGKPEAVPSDVASQTSFADLPVGEEDHP